MITHATQQATLDAPTETLECHAEKAGFCIALKLSEEIVRNDALSVDEFTEVPINVFLPFFLWLIIPQFVTPTGFDQLVLLARISLPWSLHI